nr:MAG TPA: hypothetical protein [Caudoviricetes sp.]
MYVWQTQESQTLTIKHKIGGHSVDLTDALLLLYNNIIRCSNREEVV